MDTTLLGYSMGPAKLGWLRSTLHPIHEQPQDVYCSVHVPVPQRAMAFCVSTQSHTVARGSVISATPFCKHTVQSQLVAEQQLHN